MQSKNDLYRLNFRNNVSIFPKRKVRKAKRNYNRKSFFVSHEYKSKCKTSTK